MIDVVAAGCTPGRTWRVLEFQFGTGENEEQEKKCGHAEDHGTDACTSHWIPGEFVHGVGAYRTADEDCEESDDTCDERGCGRVQLMLVFEVFAHEGNEA